MDKLRVLVVDDSAHNRQIISEMLESQPGVEVIGKAEDGEQGLKLAAQLQPHLITLDLEMPRMDGFTFLRLLMSRMPTPVIVISSHSRKQDVFQALELGALDFIAKPQRFLSADAVALREELAQKVQTVRALQPMSFARRVEASVASATDPGAAASQEQAAPVARLERVVCIGASTGGPQALQALFKGMARPANAALVVGQHMPPKFTQAFAERLNRVSHVTVQEATEDVLVEPGFAYIAPGGSHCELVQAEGGVRLRLSQPGADDRYIPSIDRLFASAAANVSVKLMAVVLTGMGSDGSKGIVDVRKKGGLTLAESKDSAIVFGMPKEAIDTGCVDAVLDLERVIERIRAFVGAGQAG